MVHFVLHVPKCAGTTVEDHFRGTLGPGFLLAPRWESPARNIIGNRYDYRPGDPRLAGVRLVSGHSLSVSLRRLFGEVRESVLLRPPLGFLLSFYNYRAQRHVEGWGPKPPPFEVWYRGQRRNPITRFLLSRYFEQGVPALYRLSSAGRLAYLEARLAGFWFVGGHTRVGELIAAIGADLGVAQVAPARNVTEVRAVTADSLDPAMVARIAADNAVDQLLHDRWAGRGFAGGPGAAPVLPRGDQAALLASDIATAVMKKWGT